MIRRFLYRIRNSTVIVAVCLIRACREFGVYLNEKDLDALLPGQVAGNGFKIRKGRRNRAMSVLVEELGPLPVSHPLNYLPMIIAGLERMGFEPEYLALIQAEARQILTTIKLPEHGPHYRAFAASCLYHVDRMHEHRLNQKEIGAASETAEYTIRDHYQNYWKTLKEVKT